MKTAIWLAIIALYAIAVLLWRMSELLYVALKHEGAIR